MKQLQRHWQLRKKTRKNNLKGGRNEKLKEETSGVCMCCNYNAVWRGMVARTCIIHALFIKENKVAAVGWQTRRYVV